MTDAPLTFTDVSDGLVPKAARYVSGRYRAYGVTADDVLQEMMCWLYGNGATNVRRWLAKSPQQSTRIYRSIVDVGRSYTEREKAARVGYEPDDIFYYTQATVEGLMPLVLDETYDGSSGLADNPTGKKHKKAPGDGDELLAAIMDIRRAIKACRPWVRDVFQNGEPGVIHWDDAVLAVINHLGGEAPCVGRRRVQSNAAAQFETRQQEAS